MKLLAVLLSLVIATSGVSAQQKKKKTPMEKLWSSLFHQEEKKPKHRASRRKKVVDTRPKLAPTPMPRPTPMRGPDGTYVVDAQWMAHYWELELAWAYPIPEDLDIKFEDGKYFVSPVVFRHYEDMVNTASNPSGYLRDRSTLFAMAGRSVNSEDR